MSGSQKTCSPAAMSLTLRWNKSSPRISWQSIALLCHGRGFQRLAKPHGSQRNTHHRVPPSRLPCFLLLGSHSYP